MKVLFVAADPKPERWTDLIRQALPEAQIRVWSPEMPYWGADYALVWQPPSELFVRETALKAIFNLGAGIDGLLRATSLPKGVPVVRLEDAGMSDQMAEYVLYQTVRLFRAMATYEQQQNAGTWKLQRPTNRRDWPIGILGLGQIGSRVASLFAALNYPVAGWARSRHRLDGVSCHAGPEALGTFLAKTRVLVNTLPLTAQTRNFMDRALMSQLPKGALVINVGRGEHLVDEDLLALLDEGHLDAAVLDVFRQEPLPETHPFWTHPKITLTPHISARTLRDATVEQITGKIKKLENSEAITGVVDMDRGY